MYAKITPTTTGTNTPIHFSRMLRAHALVVAVAFLSGADAIQPAKPSSVSSTRAGMSARQAVPPRVDDLDLWSERKSHSPGRARLLFVIDDLQAHGLPSKPVGFDSTPDIYKH